jgi:peptidoglycan/LPS O-acetylase OafA/YrhL
MNLCDDGPPVNLAYRPQLDGLRAIAILAVLIAHFVPEITTNRYVSIGYLGVELFFVLSGFLITSILLNDRTAIDTGELSRRRAFTVFYGRRSLRIFPTYYLAVLYAVVAGLGITIRTLPWFATYLTNVFISRNGLPGASTHLWSLAVEEQFYVLWSLVILLMPQRSLVPITTLAIIGGAWFRVASGLRFREYLLPSCMAYLAAGAAIAIYRRRRPVRGLAPAASFGLAALPFFRAAAVPEIIFGAVAVYLVAGAATGFRGPFGMLLESRPMVCVGRISYGLYLFHNFVPEALNKAMRFYGLNSPIVVWRIAQPIVSLGIAAASWHFIESPLQRWRRRRFVT